MPLSSTMPGALLLATLAFLGLGRRLAMLYLKRLDREQERGPAKRRLAISASRRRAQGHLWMLGAFFATALIYGLCFGRTRPALSATLVAEVAALTCAGVLFAVEAVFAYRDARAIRGGAVGGGTRLLDNTETDELSG